MKMPRLSFLFLLFLLGACGAQKPVPVDHFYRLPDIEAAAVDNVSLSDGVIYVSLFETDGLHRERAMVFGDSNQLELKQFHYQHWIDSPTRMIRDHLVQYLRAAMAAPTIVTSVEPYPQLELSGKIRRFDQIINDTENKVVVALELRADREGELVYINDYSLTRTFSGEAVPDAVAAFNSALLACFEQFVNDVKTAL